MQVDYSAHARYAMNLDLNFCVCDPVTPLYIAQLVAIETRLHSSARSDLVCLIGFTISNSYDTLYLSLSSL